MRITDTRFHLPGVFILLFSFCIVFAESTRAQQRSLPADTVITSTDEVTIKGEQVPYRVATGTQPVYGEDGKPDAALY